MSFAALPPEINSGRIFAGPGASPLLAAATAWDALSAGLTDGAAAFSSVISALVTGWMGPASLSMQQAALRYQVLLTSMAAQAESTAAQARAAATAFETALAAHVHPALIAANRARLAVLVATNLLGQNTAAIMATEVEYVEMWAQDAAAMIEYQAAAAMASPLGNLANQTAQSLLSSAPYDAPMALLSLFSSMWGANQAAQSEQIAAPDVVVPVPSVAQLSPTCVTGATDMRATVGAGRNIGLLRVPPTWAAQAGTRTSQLGGVPLAVAEENTPLPLTLPLSLPGAASKQQRVEPQYGATPTVMSRHPYGG